MALDDLIKRLRAKVVQGEHGPWNEPFVVLTEVEYNQVLTVLEEKATPPKRKPGRPRKSDEVPHVATR